MCYIYLNINMCESINYVMEGTQCEAKRVE